MRNLEVFAVLMQVLLQRGSGKIEKAGDMLCPKCGGVHPVDIQPVFSDHLTFIRKWRRQTGEIDDRSGGYRAPPDARPEELGIYKPFTTVVKVWCTGCSFGWVLSKVSRSIDNYTGEATSLGKDLV